MSSALAGKLAPDVFTHLRPVSVPASLYHLRTVVYILHGTLSMQSSVANFLLVSLESIHVASVWHNVQLGNGILARHCSGVGRLGRRFC